MVQSLIKPESKVGRRTHKFQEGLGTEFYAHLHGRMARNVPLTCEPTRAILRDPSPGNSHEVAHAQPLHRRRVGRLR